MTDQPQPKRRGCWFYGCISAVVVVIIGGLTLFFGVRYMVRKAIQSYTDSAPVQLPSVNVSPEEIQAVQERWQQFFEAVKTDKPRHRFP